MDNPNTLSIPRAALQKWVENFQRLVSVTPGGNSLPGGNMFRTDSSGMTPGKIVTSEQIEEALFKPTEVESSEGLGVGQDLPETEFKAASAALQQQQIAADEKDSKARARGSPAAASLDGPRGGGGKTRPTAPTNPSSSASSEKPSASQSRNQALLDRLEATIANLVGKRVHLSQQSPSSIGNPTPESEAMKTKLEEITKNLKTLLIKDGSK